MTSIPREQMLKELIEDIKRQLELRTAMIRAAANPTEMVEWLKPIISDPNLNGGNIPTIYYEIAEWERRLRKAKAQQQSTTQH